MMQLKKLMQVMLVTILSVSFVCTAVENPNVSSSFKANTTVPSQGQRPRLLAPSNQSIASGNDVVTGNVGGLGYFHGVVPYGSSYYSYANLKDSGSTGLNSFLRRSTNPIVSDRSPGQRQSFYQPQRMVSVYGRTNRPLTNSAVSSMSGQVKHNSSDLSNLPRIDLADEQQRPLSTNSQELELILSRQLLLKQAAENSTGKELLKDRSTFEDFFDTVLQPQDPEIAKDEKDEDEDQNSPKSEQLLLEQLQKEHQQAFLEQDFIKAPKQSGKIEGAESEDIPQHSAQGQQPALTIAEKIDLHAEAEYVRGEHKTFKSLADAKFSEYMKAAEEFLREGKFYKAADAYSLAAIWKSEDARTYTGKSFSLFAAGEYMSSAYYLNRAIEIEPALAAKKYDLAALIGNRDVFENRLIELTTWQQRSDSGELAFLMAYVLYHDGKVLQATEAIKKAEEKMPEDKATAVLKSVILPKSQTKP